MAALGGMPRLSAQSTFVLGAAYQPTIPGLIDETYNPVVSPYSQLEENAPPDPDVLGVPAAAIQPDGKVIIAGDGPVRYNVDGSLDTAFNAAAASVSYANISNIFVQLDDKIIVTSYVPGGLIGRGEAFSSVRLEPDGTPDATFTHDNDPPGVVVSEAGLPVIELQDGRYLATQNQATKRLTANGAVDATFTPTLPAGSFYVMDSAGRVVVGASNLIFRLSADGTPDASFATVSAPGQIAGLYLQKSG
jgi:uncharacterized delta-60 repeat protein